MCVIQKEEHYRGKSKLNEPEQREKGEKNMESGRVTEKEREKVGFSSPKGN